MYDHVTEFKEKLVDILGEIQNMGVIDETGMFDIEKHHNFLILLWKF